MKKKYYEGEKGKAIGLHLYDFIALLKLYWMQVESMLLRYSAGLSSSTLYSIIAFTTHYK